LWNQHTTAQEKKRRKSDKLFLPVIGSISYRKRVEAKADENASCQPLFVGSGVLWGGTSTGSDSGPGCGLSICR
jgi:hypothetical protein